MISPYYLEGVRSIEEELDISTLRESAHDHLSDLIHESCLEPIFVVRVSELWSPEAFFDSRVENTLREDIKIGGCSCSHVGSQCIRNSMYSIYLPARLIVF